MKSLNWRASPEWLLCEVVAALLRLAMGITGAAAVAVNVLWVGVPSSWWYVHWSMSLRFIGVLIFLLGFAGLFAPMVRKHTRQRHDRILYCMGALAVIIWLTCLAIPGDRPWIGEIGDVVTITGWVSVTGGLCLMWTALAPARRRYHLTAFGSPLYPR